MSEEEIRRAGVLKRVRQGELKQTEAAGMLGLSHRQVKRDVPAIPGRRSQGAGAPKRGQSIESRSSRP